LVANRTDEKCSILEVDREEDNEEAGDTNEEEINEIIACNDREIENFQDLGHVGRHVCRSGGLLLWLSVCFLSPFPLVLSLTRFL
jgi:hypothetical protein